MHLTEIAIAVINEGTQVLITQRATSKVGGYYWDKVSTPRGTGYMAREASDGSKTYLVVIGSNKNDNIAEPRRKTIQLLQNLEQQLIQ